MDIGLLDERAGCLIPSNGRMVCEWRGSGRSLPVTRCC